MLLAAVGAGAAFSCRSKAELPPLDPRCPNVQPTQNAPCTAGLVCHYSEPLGCVTYYTASCSAEGQWQIEHPCAASGGAGGGSCVDSTPGAPKVTSATKVLLPPDGETSSYTLTFNEGVAAGVASHLSWAGGGSLLGATKISDTSYLVRFSGLGPDDSAKLTVSGVGDICGTALAAPVVIDLSVLGRCHHFVEDFEADFLASGWSTVDAAGDGNVWAPNGTFAGQSGVPNHTAGDGSCASANDIDSASASKWNASLVAPDVDLESGNNVVLHFDSDFDDSTGKGKALVEASSDGTKWQPVATWKGSRKGRREHADISAYAGKPVHLRWRYQNGGGVGSWWDVDGVCVEEFTRPICACPADGIAELKDQLGKPDANGKFATAEKTLATLANVGDHVTVCGQLEDASASGADYFNFNVDTSIAKTPLTATIDYCVENAFDDVSASLWGKSGTELLVSNGTAHGAGRLELELAKDGAHFLSLAAAGKPYPKARYAMTIRVTSASAPKLQDSFETWPGALEATSDDACALWGQGSETAALPTEGTSLAYFNAYECQTGSASLESAALSFAGKTEVTLSFDMFHDTKFPQFADYLQVEYSHGSAAWTAIGPKLLRPGTTDGWKRELVDLSALAGKQSARVRIVGTSLYGYNIYLDNVFILAK